MFIKIKIDTEKAPNMVGSTLKKSLQNNSSKKENENVAQQTKVVENTLE